MSETFNQKSCNYYYERCPLCGAAAIQIDHYLKSYEYTCETTCTDTSQTQSDTCYQNSFRIQRRFSTICGLLDACDDEEREIIVRKINQYVEQNPPKHKRQRTQ